MGSNDTDIVMTIRVPDAMANRIERLRPMIANKRAFLMKSTLTRSDLVRYVLLRGIEALECERSAADTDLTERA